MPRTATKVTIRLTVDPVTGLLRSEVVAEVIIEAGRLLGELNGL